MVLSVAACLQAADDKTKALAEFSGALERLAATVAPAVVQVQVSAWCASDSGSAILSSCRVVGSGVIVDPSGYIITNEHVVRNARHIRVMLTPRPEQSGDRPAPSGKPPVLDSVVVGANREPVGKREVLEAAIVGVSRETDVALLKVEASGLPAISLNQTSTGPRQGQFVLAVGSPEGLDNTMTSGIVSAVGRQPHPDYPMLYIQTDAAINPGNSGGPLLDVEGELIGINTFMLSETGRNQGLGFAVPAGVVRYVYEQLRTHGSVRQSLVGVRVQTLTPGLAQGLGLSRGYGVMISDVLPDSPAEDAGLRPRDIITAVDGAGISALPYYTAMMYLHDPTVPVAVTALRGDQTLQFQVPAVSADDQYFKDRSIDPIESFIPELGVFGKSISSTRIVRNDVRSDTGIYVVATTSGTDDPGTVLAPGDVIVSLNGMPLRSVRELRGALHELAGDKAAVLQIERIGQFIYIERELDRWSTESVSDRGAASDSKAAPARDKH
jgi:serine protease Do